VTESSLDFIGSGGFSSPLLDAELDIVFVHGLGGHPFQTWARAQQREDFWPGWLSDELAGINFWTAGYDSGLFGSILKGRGGTIQQHASSIVDLLITREVGKKRLGFVTHSLGGLVVKQMLRQCHDSANHDCKQLLNATQGVCFIGTPHSGAGLASSLTFLLGKFSSGSVGDLQYANEALLDLAHWFSNWAPIKPIRVAAYHEVSKTNGVLVVDKVTSNPNVLGCEVAALNANHLDMCKAASTDSQVYTSIRHFVKSLCPTSSLTSHVASPEARVSTDDSAAQNDSSESSQLTSDVEAEYGYFCTEAADDRRPLATKLEVANRTHEIRRAEGRKERFAMSLHRHITQPSSLKNYVQLLSSIEARFQRLVFPAILEGRSIREVNELVMREVIEPVVIQQQSRMPDLNEGVVEGALYYLTGNCHVRWDP
jgi:hypothetical protein